MRWRECVERGLIRSAPEAKERLPGSIESAARFLRAAEKNVAIEEYEMAHLAAYNSAFHSVRAFLYAAGYIERSHACLVTAVRHTAGDDLEVAELLNAFDKLRIARHARSVQRIACLRRGSGVLHPAGPPCPRPRSTAVWIGNATAEKSHLRPYKPRPKMDAEEHARSCPAGFAPTLSRVS